MIYRRHEIGKWGNSNLFVYCCYRGETANCIEIGLGIESFDQLQLRHVTGFMLHHLMVAEFLQRLTAPNGGVELKTGPLHAFFNDAAAVLIADGDHPIASTTYKAVDGLIQIIEEVMHEAYPCVSLTQMDEYGYALVYKESRWR